MDRRYEQFNEMTFEAYVKSAIDKSVLKARKRQAAREKVEQSFSTMTDVELFAIAKEDQGIEQAERAEPVGQVFRVRGRDISVYGKRLGQALLFLPAKDREIVLMYYYLQMTDPQIALTLGISKSTVHRRRHEAIKKLHILLEDRK